MVRRALRNKPVRRLVSHARALPVKTFDPELGVPAGQKKPRAHNLPTLAGGRRRLEQEHPAAAAAFVAAHAGDRQEAEHDEPPGEPRPSSPAAVVLHFAKATVCRERERSRTRRRFLFRGHVRGLLLLHLPPPTAAAEAGGGGGGGREGVHPILSFCQCVFVCVCQYNSYVSTAHEPSEGRGPAQPVHTACVSFTGLPSTQPPSAIDVGTNNKLPARQDGTFRRGGGGQTF